MVVDGEGAQAGITRGDAQVAPELGCLFHKTFWLQGFLLELGKKMDTIMQMNL
jgi:hypothetical protein